MRPIEAPVAVRTCLGCRRRRPRPDLVRITRGRVGPTVVFVVDGPSSGRGAWLCRDSVDCVDAAIARKQFDRAWRTSLDDEQITALRAAIGAGTTTDDRDESAG